jgi:hypothetical protein
MRQAVTLSASWNYKITIWSHHETYSLFLLTGVTTEYSLAQSGFILDSFTYFMEKTEEQIRGLNP